MMNHRILKENQATPTELTARPAYLCADARPICGENFDIALCEEYPFRPSDRRLQAIGWPNASRVALLLPLPVCPCVPVPVVIPAVDAKSVLRVLRHSFSDRVALWSDGFPEIGAPRTADASTYHYLSQLIDRANAFCALASRPPVAIANRQELSCCMIGAARSLCTFLGVELPGADLRAFPVREVFAGQLSCASMYSMFLLLALGVLHGFDEQDREHMRIELDEGLLIPRLCIPGGNKTSIPPEWESCRRMSAAVGAYFEIIRHRDAILARFCPLSPYIPPEEFYTVRTGVELAWWGEFPRNTVE